MKKETKEQMKTLEQRFNNKFKKIASEYRLQHKSGEYYETDVLFELQEELLKAVEDYYLENESLGKFIEDLSEKDKQVACSLNKFLSNLRDK